MAKRNQRQQQAPPAPSRREIERQEEQQIATNENNFLEDALSAIPDLENKRPPGHEDPPAGDDDPPEPPPEDLAPPPAAKTAPPVKEEPPGQPPVQKAPAAPAPPVEVPPVDDKKGKAVGEGDKKFVDEALEGRLAAIVPKGAQQEAGFPPLKTLIRELNTRIKTELEPALKKKDEELEAITQKVLPDEKIQQYQALDEYVRHTAVENHPEFQAKYAQKTAKANDDAVNFLTQMGMSPQIADVLKTRGGLLKFSKSNEVATGADGKPFHNTDGSEMTEQQFFEKYIFGVLPESSKAQIGALMAKGHSIERERQEEIDKAKKEGPEFFTKRQQAFISDFNKRAQNKIVSLIPELPDDLPRDIVVIPDDATPEEKTRLEEQNAAFKEADDYVSKMVMAQTPEDRSEVATYAAVGKYLLKERTKTLKQIADLTKRAEDAEAKLDAINDSRSLNKRRGAPPVPPKLDQRSDTNLSDAEAVDKYL